MTQKPTKVGDRVVQATPAPKFQTTGNGDLRYYMSPDTVKKVKQEVATHLAALRARRAQRSIPVLNDEVKSDE